MNLHERIIDWLDALPASQRRSLREVLPLGDGCVEIDGQTVVDFASNDYLGLAHHQELIDRANTWMQEFGAGSRASRLISGNLQPLDRLENKLARLKGTETSLIFGSGFQANSSVLAALVDRQLRHAGAVNVFSDRLCHASFHFGLAAGGVKQFRYRHHDLQHLEQLLEEKSTDDSAALIATESIFSMEGDCLDVEALREIAQRHDAMLYVDEAHATGVTGENGMGLMAGTAADPTSTLQAPAARERRNEVVIGTFGKALGSYGAYVACSQPVRDYLVNRCGGLIYSTALPPMVLGAIDAALDLVPAMNAEREHLQELSRHLCRKLGQNGFESLQSDSQIIPIVMSDDSRVLPVARQLLNAGYLVGAIRPPTVPPGTARLRVSLSAAHTKHQVESFVKSLSTLLESVGVSG